MGATEELARFACELEFEQVPPEALSWAKDAILDCTGVALAGAQEDAGRIITDYVREGAGRPEAGVFAAGFKSAAGSAARAISPERIDRSLDMLQGLEELRDISELMDVLCA